MALQQICFEHHVHDRSCYSDPAENERQHRAWCKAQCEKGWPGMPREHAPIKIDPTWNFCPLCGAPVR